MEGQEIGYYDGHNKKTKGSKVHAAVVTSISLPIAIDVGPGNEQHESRKLISLLKDIRIRDRYHKTPE